MVVPGKRVPVGELFRALGREMGDMAASCERLQTILALACASAGNHRFLGEAQDCDLLTQKLLNLTGFFDAVAQTVPEEWGVNVGDACHNVSLSGLADRLRLEPSQEREEAGKLELFE